MISNYTKAFLNGHQNTLKMIIQRLHVIPKGLNPTLDHLLFTAERLLSWLETMSDEEIGLKAQIDIEFTLLNFYTNVNETLDIDAEELIPASVSSGCNCLELQKINRRLWMIVAIAALALYHFW